MAKRSGLGMRYHLGGYDLSGDTRDFGEIGGGNTPFEMTPIIKEAFERQGGQLDGRMSWVSFFSTGTDEAHEVLSTLPTTDRVATAYFGATIGSEAASINGKQINYDLTRAANGELTLAVNVQGNGYGLEFGTMHTAVPRTDTAATDGAGVDGAAASSFGLQAYLQVLAFAGTDATVKLQESSDNGAGDAWADVVGGAFTAVTSTTPQTQRIETARDLAVERYLRVVTTTSAGFTSLQFAVMVARNLTETRF